MKTKKFLTSTFIFFATILSIASICLTGNLVQAKEKPMVVMFKMSGCSACKKFSPIFDKFAARFANKFNFVKEDVSSSKLAQNLSFPTVPAIFIIEPGTNKATRIDDSCAWDEGCFTKRLQDY